MSAPVESRIQTLAQVWCEGRRVRVIETARTQPDVERKLLAWQLVNFCGATAEDVREIWSITTRHICTAADPYDSAEHGRACHPDAREVGEQVDGYPGGDLVRYLCPHCATSWMKELAQ